LISEDGKSQQNTNLSNQENKQIFIKGNDGKKRKNFLFNIIIITIASIYKKTINLRKHNLAPIDKINNDIKIFNDNNNNFINLLSKSNKLLEENYNTLNKNLRTKTLDFKDEDKLEYQYIRSNFILCFFIYS
jgi:hypothetical protein